MLGLVLLHGFGGSPESWEGFRARLPKDQVTWTPLLTGHGIPCTEGIGFPDEVERLMQGLSSASARTGVEDWWVVGYSMGGRLALGMLFAAAAAGKPLRGASLVGANPGLAGEVARQDRRDHDARWARRLEEEGITAFLDAWRRQPLFASQDRLDASTLDEQRRITLAHDAKHLACALRGLSLGAMPDFTDRLGELAVTTDWIVGSLDQKFLGLAGMATRQMPDARLVSVPDVGHNVLLEAPDQLARLVLERVRGMF